MAAVQCQRLVSSGQAVQVRTLQSELCSKEQQDIVTRSIGSGGSSSVAFPTRLTPPTCRFSPNRVLSMSSSVCFPPEGARGASLRARSPNGEQRRPSPSCERFSSCVIREQSPGRAQSPVRDTLVRCAIELPARPRSPIQEHQPDQVLLDAVARAYQNQMAMLMEQPLYRGRHTSPRRQSSPTRQISSLWQASPLRQTSSIQREQSPLFRRYGSSVNRMTSTSPLRATSPIVPMPAPYSSARFQNLSPVSPRRPMPTSNLAPPPQFTPPPALPSSSASFRGAPGVNMFASRELTIPERESFLTESESFLQPTVFDAYGRSLAPPVGEGSDRHLLRIDSNDNPWDSIAFQAGDNIEKTASSWLQKKGLNPEFQKGLVEQMRQMVKTNLKKAEVDIVDLL